MNELQTTNQKTNLIVGQMQSQFAKVLPKIITPERFCRVMLSAINKNPTLTKALMDERNKAAVLSAFMRCAEMGLEPDGRRAVINAYEKKQSGTYDITLIPMYQGLSELAMRSGQISNIHADKVCENDDFTWDTGEIHHKVNFREPRGATYAYYCIVRFKDGSTKTETMSLEEVNQIREKSSSYQAFKRYGKSCPWTEYPDEMGKKTVFRRCSKWLPLSPELRDAFEIDDDDYQNNRMAQDFTADKFAQAVAQAENAKVIEPEVIEQPIEQPESENPQEQPAKASDNLFQEK